MNKIAQNHSISADKIATIATNIASEGLGSFKQAITGYDTNATEALKSCESNIESMRKRQEHPETSFEEFMELDAMIKKQQDLQSQILNRQEEHDERIVNKAIVFGGIMLAITLALADPKRAEQYFKAGMKLAPSVVKHLKAA